MYSQARKLMYACICMPGHAVCLWGCGVLVCYCYSKVDLVVHKEDLVVGFVVLCNRTFNPLCQQSLHLLCSSHIVQVRTCSVVRSS